MRLRYILIAAAMGVLPAPAWSESPAVTAVQVTFNINLLHIPSLCLIKLLRDDAPAYRECRKISARSELRVEAGDFGSISNTVEVTDDQLNERMTEELENLGPLLRAAAFGRSSRNPLAPQTVISTLPPAAQAAEADQRLGAKTSLRLTRTAPVTQPGGPPANINARLSPPKDRKPLTAARLGPVDEFEKVPAITGDKPKVTVRPVGSFQGSVPVRRGSTNKTTHNGSSADRKHERSHTDALPAEIGTQAPSRL